MNTATENGKEWQCFMWSRVNHRQGQHRADEIQETLNYWKQISNVLKYFREEEGTSVALPKNFMSGFLEVRTQVVTVCLADMYTGSKLSSAEENASNTKMDELAYLNQ